MVILQKVKKMVELISIIYLTQYVQNIVISILNIKITTEMFTFFFSY